MNLYEQARTISQKCSISQEYSGNLRVSDADDYYIIPSALIYFRHCVSRQTIIWHSVPPPVQEPIGNIGEQYQNNTNANIVLIKEINNFLYCVVERGRGEERCNLKLLSIQYIRAGRTQNIMTKIDLFAQENPYKNTFILSNVKLIHI